MKPADVTRLIQETNAHFIDFKFIDLPGRWQHFSIPVSEYSEDLFEEGLGFDGSSVAGWKSIDSSDMLVMPDPVSAKIDPFIDVPTLSLICDVVDPITRQAYERDPRGVARRAEAFLGGTGFADTAYFGPEAEFFIFDDVRYQVEPNASFFEFDSAEAAWNSGTSGRGYPMRSKGGYVPVAPSDQQNDLRNEMVLAMEALGIRVERQHHEVATAGQAEIDVRFDSLLAMADKLMWFKYVVRNVAARNGKVATFMPKPMFGDNGSGMHTHQSLWKGGKPLFAGPNYAGLSEMALFYIGGILKHADALCALTNPSTNSYRRLVPGYEAPNKMAYSARNRSASIRIPMFSASPAAKRIEYRTPDPTCNPYLAFSAMMMAGIDGIVNKIHPGEPMEKNIYDLPPEEAAKVPSAPGSLEAALAALQKDHEFLLRGDVFSQDLVETWIQWKWDNEINPSRLRPTPMEFSLYFDL